MERAAISRALQPHAEDESNFNFKSDYKHVEGKFQLDGTKLASKMFSFLIKKF